MALSFKNFKDRLSRSGIWREMLARSFPFIRQKALVGGAAGNLTITGIRVGDQLVSVISCNTGAANNGYADLTSEFTITADNTINNTGGTSSATYGVVVTWLAWENRT